MKCVQTGPLIEHDGVTAAVLVTVTWVPQLANGVPFGTLSKPTSMVNSTDGAPRSEMDTGPETEQLRALQFARPSFCVRLTRASGSTARCRLATSACSRANTAPLVRAVSGVTFRA